MGLLNFPHFHFPGPAHKILIYSNGGWLGSTNIHSFWNFGLFENAIAMHRRNLLYWRSRFCTRCNFWPEGMKEGKPQMPRVQAQVSYNCIRIDEISEVNMRNLWRFVLEGKKLEGNRSVIYPEGSVRLISSISRILDMVLYNILWVHSDYAMLRWN